MKKLFFIFGIAGLLFTSCVSNPEGEKAVTGEAAEIAASEGADLTVNTESSNVEWAGKKMTATHHGEIKIKEGKVHVNGDQLTAGKFVIDMTSFENFDQEGEWKVKLEGHLASEDFFHIEEHPEAVLEITNVEGSGVGTTSVSANLTIKGITKNITFNADVTDISESSFAASADFNIERFDWDITYPGMPDDLISKEINFKVNISAN